ncbi:hypothetical protein [Streptomyces sp. NPDC050546]|uniref:hypothetical protein n=1 Tax=Streptomyces sp. NPDC050546 TaxID=3365628 RepID=UPI0037B4FE60
MQYTEKTPKVWSGICITAYLIGVSYMGADTIPDEFGLWLGLCALFLLVLLPFLAVPVSKFIYNRIQIDTHTLRVGRERISLADIDPTSVKEASQAGPSTTAGQRAASINTINVNSQGQNSSGPTNHRIAGGGWGVPMGMESVVIRTRNGESLRFATRNRAAFLNALLQAVSRSSAAVPE